MAKLKSTEIKLSEGLAPKKIQILRTGSFKSESHGDFEIKADDLLSMKNNFDNKVKGYADGKLPIDYFHENEKVAAGWIDKVYLANKNTELWADVEWTPAGEKKIEDKELRYISADMHFDYKDKETEKTFGPTLNGAALTNIPFITNMEPVVQLSEKDLLTIKSLLKRLSQGGTMPADMEALQKQVAELQAKVEALEKGEEGEEPAADKKPPGEGQQEKADGDMADMKKAMGEMKEKHDALQAKYDEMMSAGKMSEKKSKFDLMLAEGKVVEAQRESFMKDDTVQFANLAIKTNFAGHGHSGGGKETPKSAQAEVLKLAGAMATEKKINLSQAIPLVLQENEELNSRYKKEVQL